MSPEEELRKVVREVLALAMNAQWMAENRQWSHLHNQLNRIMRTALEGTYCIGDIGDFT